MKEYCGRIDEGIAKSLMCLARSSVADIAIAPLQDILGLGEKAHINMHGTQSGNWLWKFKKRVFTDKHAEWLANLTKTYCR